MSKEQKPPPRTEFRLPLGLSLLGFWRRRCASRGRQTHEDLEVVVDHLEATRQHTHPSGPHLSKELADTYPLQSRQGSNHPRARLATFPAQRPKRSQAWRQKAAVAKKKTLTQS